MIHKLTHSQIDCMVKAVAFDVIFSKPISQCLATSSTTETIKKKEKPSKPEKQLTDPKRELVNVFAASYINYLARNILRNNFGLPLLFVLTPLFGAIKYAHKGNPILLGGYNSFAYELSTDVFEPMLVGTIFGPKLMPLLIEGVETGMYESYKAYKAGKTKGEIMVCGVKGFARDAIGSIAIVGSAVTFYGPLSSAISATTFSALSATAISLVTAGCAIYVCYNAASMAYSFVQKYNHEKAQTDTGHLKTT